MDTTKLTEKFNAFRNHRITVEAIEIGTIALTSVAISLTINVVTFVVMAGAQALIEKINKQDEQE